MFTKFEIAKAVVAGAALGLVFYALGGVVDPYIAGITAPHFGAAGFALGFANKFLE
ncbi:MAG: hypothetical protein J7K36_09030 [Archaeoglobaceae archaeon]|nr:hypothetical protein [Archaeoglobaceae archaeon]